MSTMIGARFCVYVIRCSVNGKTYVGKTCDLRDRWREHWWIATSPARSARALAASRPLYKAMRKYGEGAFSLEVVHECDVESEAFDHEKKWIATLGSFGPGGYNVTAGGDGQLGVRHTEESKARLRAQRLGTKASAETRAKLSAMRKGRSAPEVSARQFGELNPFFGKKHTKESRAKMSAALTGKPSPMKGKRLPPEQAAACTARLVLDGSPMRGKKHTEETKSVISQKNRGKVPWQRRRAPWRIFLPKSNTQFMRLWRAAKKDDALEDRFPLVDPMDYEEDRHLW